MGETDFEHRLSAIASATAGASHDAPALCCLRFALILFTPEFTQSLSPGAAHLTRSRGILAHLLSFRGLRVCEYLPAYKAVYDAHAGLPLACPELVRSLSPCAAHLTRNRGAKH